MAKTLLKVTPQPTKIKVGQDINIAIETDAEKYAVSITPENIVKWNENRVMLQGVGIGECRITISATADGKDSVEVSWAANVISLNAPNIEFGDPEEILENTYHYDDTLPTSTGGTIAYKKGHSSEDPLIKLVFDGDAKRWRVVGCKMVNYNQNGEAYDLYFLASEGALQDSLEGMNLEQVIIDLIDNLFIQETPNMSATIENLFETTIKPLLEAEYAKIPQMVQNAVDEEMEAILNQKIEEKLESTFGELIEEKVRENILNYNYGTIQPYHNNDIPKWTGIVVAENASPLNWDAMNYFVKRINSCGIDEHWRSNDLDLPPMNHNSNDDPLTKLFNKIEPFATMDRMVIPLKEFANYNGDAIYSKESFQRLMSQSVDKTHKMWNGDYIGDTANFEKSIRDQAWAWFVPIKKAYYIDVIISIKPDEDSATKNTTYLLKAVGSEPFKINLKDIFPNHSRFSLYSFVAPEIGYKEYVIDTSSGGAVISSQLHPCFLNYYDTQRNILTAPLELEYRYLGAFQDTLMAIPNASQDIPAGINTAKYRAVPRPFAEAMNYLNFKNTSEALYWHIYGDNPTTGTNFTPSDVYIWSFMRLLIDIESGYSWACNKTWLRGRSKWGFNSEWTNGDISLQTGATFMLRNKTGTINAYDRAIMFNYRGVEKFYWENLYGTAKHPTTQKIWRHKPHTHRIKETLWTYDNNWIETEACRIFGSGYHWAKHLGNAIDVFLHPLEHPAYKHTTPPLNNTHRVNADGGSEELCVYNMWASAFVSQSHAYWDSVFRSYI